MKNILLKYQEFVSLNESKSSARRRFLDSGKLDQETFNELVNIDPSPTYKYVEKMISFYLEGIPIETLKKEIKTYDELTSRNLIKSKDVNQLSYQEFKNLVSSGSNTLSSRKEQKDLESGATILLDNEFYRVVVPDTEEASCRYGAGTKWCTSATKSENHFKRYRYGDGVTLYYILDKSKDSSDTLQQIAVSVYPDGNKEVFNSLDTPISFSNIPKELFKYFPKEEFKLRDVSGRVDPFNKYELDKSKATLNPDGTYDYDGDVYLSVAGLTELPIKFKNVKGDFDCSENEELKSLEGAPKSVGGNFNCYSNDLENLKGAPESVGGGFYCSSNQLKSLEGAPKYVGGYFDCSRNQLKSLEGAPESVGGYFDCSRNQLKSLEGAPKYVGGYFDCSRNQLKSLEGAPESVGGDFDCRYNPDLKSLDGIGEVKGNIDSDIK